MKRTITSTIEFPHLHKWNIRKHPAGIRCESVNMIHQRCGEYAEISKVGTVGDQKQVFSGYVADVYPVLGIFPDPLLSVYGDIWKQNPSGMRCGFSRILSICVTYTGVSRHRIVPYLYCFSAVYRLCLWLCHPLSHPRHRKWIECHSPL